MSDTLNQLERRVLGVLIEKSLAQPQYYPMTLNAVVAGCNQKSNRDPEMELDEDAIWQTLDVLRQKGLVARLMPAGGSRTDRFKHEANAIFGWEKPQRAIMAELLLRGPQTLGELRTRCSRMYAFEGLDAVSAVLDTLTTRTPPHVALIPRQPGQSAQRYMHLFYPERDRPTDPVSTTAIADSPGAARASPDAAPRPVETPPNSLITQIDALRSEIGELRQRVAELERRATENA